MRDSFTVESIMQRAIDRAGLDDFGGHEFVTPFEKLIDSLNNEAELSDNGQEILRESYTNLLVNRLRFEEDLKKHPEILYEKILPPIAVMGLPRSGTTKMQRVLGAHPGVQGLRTWQLMNVAPLPGYKNQSKPDPRIRIAEDATAKLMESHPELLAGHPVAAMDYDEETCYLMEMTFDGPLVPVRARTPDYSAWRWQQSMVPSYHYLRKLLQYIQWQNKSAALKPYLLKSPIHLGHIQDFAEVFPEATVVHCHRDPIDSVPSFAKLVEGGWRMLSNIDDMHVFGEAAVELMATHVNRYIEQRPKVEDLVTFVDVDFSAIVSDSMAVAGQVFEAYGGNLKMDDEAIRKIDQWEKENPATKFGKHEYSLERYGLTHSGIRSRFSDYYNQFL